MLSEGLLWTCPSPKKKDDTAHQIEILLGVCAKKYETVGLEE
jgi:hypothetical protein